MRKHVNIERYVIFVNDDRRMLYKFWTRCGRFTQKKLTIRGNQALIVEKMLEDKIPDDEIFDCMLLWDNL